MMKRRNDWNNRFGDGKAAGRIVGIVLEEIHRQSLGCQPPNESALFATSNSDTAIHGAQAGVGWG